MKRYQVTQTATAEVWAKNEMEAIEYATGEFFAFPEYNHEVIDTTPRVNANLNDVKILLESFGVTPVDVVHPHHIQIPRLDIGLHKHENHEGNLVPCSRFSLFGQTDDGENWNGKGWFLETCETEEVATFTNLDSMALAGALAYQIGRAMFDLESRGRK